MLFQQSDAFVVHHRAVVHRPHSGANGCFDAIGAVGVGGHEAAPALRLLDGDGDLFVRVLLCAGRDPLGEHGAGRENLNEVRAVLEVRAHRVADGVHSIRERLDDGNLHVDRELPGVAGTAGRSHVVSRHHEPRPGDDALIDGVTEIDVDVRPGRAHVATGGEPGAESGEGVSRSRESRLRWRRLEQDVLPMHAFDVGQVGMEIDETRQEGGASEVDDLRTRRNLVAHRFDTVATDDDDRGGKLLTGPVQNP